MAGHPVAQLLALAHLVLVALWLGSMGYSLVVVQPKVARYFTDPRQREDFLTTLAQGNRWPVVALVSGLLATGVGTALAAPVPVGRGYALALPGYAAAAVIFVDVSWRHWPARVFATLAEVPGFQRRLRRRAWAMVLLVGAGFLVALAATLSLVSL